MKMDLPFIDKSLRNADKYLNSQGKLYFEIGYKQGEDLRKLLSLHFPDKHVRILKDQFGQDRMVVMDDGKVRNS